MIEILSRVEPSRSAPHVFALPCARVRATAPCDLDRMPARGLRPASRALSRQLACSRSRCLGSSSTASAEGLNKYSRRVTQPKDQGASQVSSGFCLGDLNPSLTLRQAMLWATDGVNAPDDLNKAMVGVASVWCAQALLREERNTEKMP